MLDATAQAPAQAPTAGVPPGFLTQLTPVLRREGIRWKGGVGGRPLQIELCFKNPGRRASEASTAHVEVAEFGAFVPSRPLLTAAVPPIPPGGSHILTATAAGDAPLPDPRNWRVTERNVGLLRSLRIWTAGDRSKVIPIERTVHFVGNLNVFVTRSAPVERHVAQAVGLAAGGENIARFIVGDGQRDSYTFRVAAEPGWDVKLEGAKWDRPVEISKASILAVIRPPAKADSGRVSILVHRASTGQTVPVEFDLDVAVGRAKCWTF